MVSFWNQESINLANICLFNGAIFKTTEHMLLIPCPVRLTVFLNNRSEKYTYFETYNCPIIY